MTPISKKNEPQRTQRTRRNPRLKKKEDFTTETQRSQRNPRVKKKYDKFPVLSSGVAFVSFVSFVSFVVCFSSSSFRHSIPAEDQIVRCYGNGQYQAVNSIHHPSVAGEYGAVILYPDFSLYGRGEQVPERSGHGQHENQRHHYRKQTGQAGKNKFCQVHAYKRPDEYSDQSFCCLSGAHIGNDTVLAQEAPGENTRTHPRGIW